MSNRYISSAFIGQTARVKILDFYRSKTDSTDTILSFNFLFVVYRPAFTNATCMS